MLSLRANHVFYTFATEAPVDPYEPINLLAQLCSTLLWRKHFGPMDLVCDSHHLRRLAPYGIEQAYDRVDTTTLTQMPEVDIRYWAFAKLFLARELARRTPEVPVVILDTDLWLTQVPEKLRHPAAPVIGFHREDFDVNYGHNPYVEPELFLGYEPNDLNWDIEPLNTALLYVNHPELIEAWYEMALEVIGRNRMASPLGNSSEIVFIEQRLLPTLAEKFNLSVDSLIPATYHTAPDFTPKSTRGAWSNPAVVPPCLATMRHIWSSKQHYDHPGTRAHLVNLLLADLRGNFTRQELAPYDLLFGDAQALASPHALVYAD